jgi:hypothetical protein
MKKKRNDGRNSGQNGIEVKHFTETDVVVCAPVDNKPLMFADNLTSRCAECFRLIQFRPHAPQGRKLCIECALPRITSEQAHLITTPTMLDDFHAYLRRKLQ